MQHLLSDSDLKVAKAEARELWVAVNSRDVTGKIDKVIEGDPIMKAEMKKNFNDVMKSASMSHLTGRKFEPVEHRAPRPVGEPTRLRGYARGFGIAGGVLSVAQAPSYATQYGMKRGAWELFKDVVDPFGVSDGSNPPVSNVCQLGVNCA
ncbi:hypothetical protein ABZ663_31535 [Streptomyces albidoflavus]